MHTFIGSQGTIFNYNSDMSGKVDIRATRENGMFSNFQIPAFDILEFIAEFVKLERFKKLEQMDAHELLDL